LKLVIKEALLDIFDTAKRLDRVPSPGAIIDELCTCTARYGFTACLITRLPVPHVTNWHEHILANGWPPEWYAYYNAHRLYRHDPCAERSRKTAVPFFWHELGRGSLSQPAKIVMDTAREFGLREGICVPLHLPFSQPATVTFAGEFLDVPPYASFVVQALAHLAFHSALRFADRPNHAEQPALSEREREILQWVAAGKTAWEISKILGISRHTASTHLRNIRQKYDAATIAHTVVEALRHHDIQL